MTKKLRQGIALLAAVACTPLMAATPPATTISAGQAPCTSAVCATHGSLSQQIRRATGGIEICGNVVYSENDSTGKRAHQGMYSFGLDGNLTCLANKYLDSFTSSVMLDGVWHCYYAQTGLFGISVTTCGAYDTDTWKVVATPVTAVMPEHFPFALCTDGKNVYGEYWAGGDQWRFGRFDVRTNTFTDSICPVTRQWNACVYKDGMVYAIDYGGDFWKVNPATGETVKVGATGVVPKYTTGAVIDPRSGRMFWTVSPEDKSGNLYEVNTATGVATKLCQFAANDEVAGLYMPIFAADKAPAAVSGMELEMPGGSRTGKVSFTCPTTLYDGTAASGPLTYTVLAGDSVVSTGSCAFGQNVSAPVSVLENNKYTIAVMVSNDQGDSPRKRITSWIGYDKPNSPKNVQIAYADGAFTVSWEAPTKGYNDGYVDLDSLTYTLKRYPGNMVVAEGVSGTKFVDQMPEPDTYTTYYYNVQAVNHGMGSFWTKSNLVGIGVVKAPYLEPFNSKAALDNFTIIDANADKKTWAYSSTAVRATYNSGKAMDDWLITPPMRLEQGKVYKFGFDAKCYNVKYPEKFEVKMATEPTVEAMTTEVMPATDVTEKDYRTFSALVKVPETGVRHFGIHGISAKNMRYLYVDNMTLTEVDVPAPSCLVGHAAGKDISLSWTAPAQNADSLSLVGYNVYRDDARVNTAPVDTPVYVDANCPDGLHKYVVTALYAGDIESAASDSYQIRSSVVGIASGISIGAGRGYIAVSGAEGHHVAIVSAAGTVCHSALANGPMRVSLLPGVYIVRVGSVTAKVVVN